MENRRWKIEDRRWKIADGGWKTADTESIIAGRTWVSNICEAKTTESIRISTWIGKRVA
jgi:hypothetical protein